MLPYFVFYIVFSNMQLKNQLWIS
ncbi:hypothetical protein Zm00014a_002154 [Zea mays]|uniref:Uncharacterized protein n=1 Tax=Zea mays TaxID=4577 RepID=A0A3L6F0K8_MAIZE|nr:hypothetical protein Zm00014a_002154 [Zea mays]